MCIETTANVSSNQKFKRAQHSDPGAVVTATSIFSLSLQRDCCDGLFYFSSALQVNVQGPCSAFYSFSSSLRILSSLFFQVCRWCQAIRRKRRSRVSKSQLKKIPINNYQKGDQYDTCAICLEEYEEGEKLRLLPCKHSEYILKSCGAIAHPP